MPACTSIRIDVANEKTQAGDVTERVVVRETVQASQKRDVTRVVVLVPGMQSVHNPETLRWNDRYIYIYIYIGYKVWMPWAGIEHSRGAEKSHVASGTVCTR